MRKFLHLIACVSLAAGLCACNSNESVLTSGDTMPDPGPEIAPEATLSFSQAEVTVGGSAFDKGETTLQSNQRVFEAVSDKTWVKAEIEGKILRAVATEPNKTGSIRTAVITVTAGKGDNTQSAPLTIHQELWDESTEQPVLNLLTSTAVLSAEIGSTQTVGFETNKDQVTAAVEDGIDWLSAEIVDNTVVLKALTANDGAQQRETIVTVTAGLLTNSISLPLTVKQRVALPTGLQIGAAYEDGLIVEVGADESYVKIISLTEQKQVWSTENVDTGIVTSNDDGIGNTATLAAMPNYNDGAYPAAKFCTDMGQGWYLPSRGELKSLSDATKAIQTEINTYLEALEGAPLDFNTYYWTSNQNTAEKANTVRLRDKGQAPYAKSTTPRPTRAMKKITLK